MIDAVVFFPTFTINCARRACFDHRVRVALGVLGVGQAVPTARPHARLPISALARNVIYRSVNVEESRAGESK